MLFRSEARADLERLYPGMKCLCSLVKRYHDLNMGVYRKINRFTYDEISHFALSLVVESYEPETREYIPTPLAVSMSEKFSEVMIAEYQDTNGLQDLFFTAISDGGRKIFSVGDVKQCIYGFRRAEPENFIRKTGELDRKSVV